MNYKKGTKHNKKVGKYGEKLAKNYLISKGFKIIGQNIQVGRQEIDILAKIKGFTVFFEVKTRTSKVYGSAEDSINTSKISQLRIAMSKYTEDNQLDSAKIRFDLLAIDIVREKKIAKIRHYRDII